MVRSKFACANKKVEIQSIWNEDTKSSNQQKVYTYQFYAVSSGSPENKKFFASTPSGTLQLSCLNGDLFEPGKEYYLNMSEA